MGYGELIPYTGYRVLYKLEDSNDNSGNSRNLANLNSVPFNLGRFKNGADFGSSGSNKSLDESAGGNILSALTVSAYTVGFWFKLNNTTSSNSTAYFTAIYTRVNGTGGQRLRFTYNISGGNITITCTQTLSTTDLTASYTFAADSNWHRIEYVRESTTSCTLYMDGAQVATGTGTGTDTSASLANGAFISIGNFPQTSGVTQQAWAIIDNYVVEETNWPQRRISKFYTQAKGGSALMLCSSY